MSATVSTEARVYDVVAEVLAEAGASCMFGLMGEDTAPLVVAAAARGIPYYPARHENQAVAMADGYSRATGRIGVASVTGGPGFSNALTAINTAHRAGSRVLVITGTGRPTEDDHDPGVIREGTLTNVTKYFPHAATLGLLGIDVVKPLVGASTRADSRQAVRLAGDGTVVLALARELMHEEVHERDDTPLAPPDDLSAEAPDSETISTFADLLQESWAVRRPVILAGRGAVLSGAAPALKRLGELTGALLATTLRATSLFRGDPYDVGVCGTYATPVASELITQADSVLAFGAALNQFTTYRNTLFPKALVVQVDKRESALGRHLEVELAIQADARLVAEELVAELERRGHSEVGYRVPETRDAIAAHRPSDITDESTAELIDIRTLMRELDRILPPDRILCVDAGQFAHFAIGYIGVQQPENFMQSVDVGSIGLGLGTGIGAAIGRRDSLTVVAAGDAGMMMSLGDLETAVRLRLPILVVVCNDEALGSEVNILAHYGMETDLAKIPSPSFEAIAVAMGAHAATIRSVRDLAIVEEWLRTRAETPLVLDCRINPAVRGWTVTTSTKTRAPAPGTA